MKTMSASDLRANLASALDAVEDDAEELVITRAGHEPLVVISLREYESMRETEYLMGNPSTAARLRASLAQLGDTTKLVTKSLQDLQDTVEAGDSDAEPGDVA